MPPSTHHASHDDEFERLLDTDPNAALEQALAWLEEEPESGDAHYAAGLAYEALERHAEKVRAFLEVLRLDARDPIEGVADAERIVHDEAEKVLGGLPAEIRDRLGPVAILVEPRPSSHLVEDGFDPRLLGFFDGATFEELTGPDAPPTPTQIRLFVENLTALASDETTLRREVGVTVLHEIGHFFGLDEDDMVRLGID